MKRAVIGLIGLALVVLPLKAHAAPVVTVPVDQAARDRFPNANKNEVDALAFINKVFNSAIEPVTDLDHYKRLDQWVSHPADGKGDCEDYATTKLVFLEEAGFDVVARSRLRFVYVHDPSLGTGGHVVLEIRLTDGSIAVLDNLHKDLMTESELKRTWNYTFYDWN